MLTLNDMLRMVLGRPASGRFVDLVWTRYHPPYLARRRLATIDARISVAATVCWLLTLIWIAFDAVSLSAQVWPFLAAFRFPVVLVFMRLASPPKLEVRRARTLTMLGIMVAMPLVIYGVSQYLLAGMSLHGLAAINGNLYRALPLMVLAGLSIFPLVAVEGLLFAAAVVCVVAMTLRVLVGMHAIELLSNLWVLVLITGVYLTGCAVQLNNMMIVVHRASHDPLTDALTHGSGVEVLDLHFRLACTRDVPLSVLSVSLGKIGPINDRASRKAHDQALKCLAAELLAVLRLADVVIRWGDGQFVVILANTPMHGASVVVDRIIHGAFGAGPDGTPLTVCMGLAERNTDGAADWWELVKLSGERMHVAGSSGKTCGVDHEGIMSGNAQSAAASPIRPRRSI